MFHISGSSLRKNVLVVVLMSFALFTAVTVGMACICAGDSECDSGCDWHELSHGCGSQIYLDCLAGIDGPCIKSTCCCCSCQEDPTFDVCDCKYYISQPSL